MAVTHPASLDAIEARVLDARMTALEESNVDLRLMSQRLTDLTVQVTKMAEIVSGLRDTILLQPKGLDIRMTEVEKWIHQRGPQCSAPNACHALSARLEASEAQLRAIKTEDDVKGRGLKFLAVIITTLVGGATITTALYKLIKWLDK